ARLAGRFPEHISVLIADHSRSTATAANTAAKTTDATEQASRSPVASGSSHRLAVQHRTHTDGLDTLRTLTCGYGFWRTGRTGCIDDGSDRRRGRAAVAVKGLSVRLPVLTARGLADLTTVLPGAFLSTSRGRVWPRR